MDIMHVSKRYKPSSSGLDALAVPVDDEFPIGSSVRPQRRGNEPRGRRKKNGGNRINRSASIGSLARGYRRREDGADRFGQKRKWPKCLNPVCDELHFIDDCPRTSDAEGGGLKDQYHANKKARSDESVDRKKGKFVGSIERSGASPDNSSMFSVSFCKGAVEVTVLADQGSDGNLISPSVLKFITDADPNVLIKQLPAPVHFSNAHTAAQNIACSRDVTADVLLRIRHGNNLVLRGMKWLVSDDEVQHVFVARHFLAALGTNNCVLLTAVSDLHSGVVNVPDLLNKSGRAEAPLAGGHNSIHSILRDRRLDFESTFHSESVADEDHLEDSNVCVDLGEESPEELKEALLDIFKDARNIGLSENGTERLKGILHKYPVLE